MIIEFIAVKGHNCVHGVSKSCRTDILRHTLITSFFASLQIAPKYKNNVEHNILDYLNVDKTSWIILMLVKEWSKRCPFLTSRSSCSMDVGPQNVVSSVALTLIAHMVFSTKWRNFLYKPL